MAACRPTNDTAELQQEPQHRAQARLHLRIRAPKLQIVTRPRPRGGTSCRRFGRQVAYGEIDSNEKENYIARRTLSSWLSPKWCPARGQRLFAARPTDSISLPPLCILCITPAEAAYALRSQAPTRQAVHRTNASDRRTTQIAVDIKFFDEYEPKGHNSSSRGSSTEFAGPSAWVRPFDS
ncbi:hypothetical protein BDY21DRAFT_366746 [Lineolata rhizophorae]|uniref:Uncharacterized protein n=1 Tax=Lineolata rhizophorae TaxID=578093 RepID=A0A6A6NPN0_9PEZI|nr:hypothetical protein BDY21DRAFT_366746 [Lineolata rhizophorae]